MLTANAIPGSGIYSGTLRHRRFEPVLHQFTYPIFMSFLDIDRIPELMRVARFASHNHFNWTSFDDRDHLGNPAQTLRERLSTDAAANGVRLPDGPIFLLTHLRYLGYAFNPISLFYCYGGTGCLEAVLAEVNSTFGERRNYWLTDANRQRSDATRSHRFRCAKTMHVSPFMAMEFDYDFVLTPPAERLVAHMNVLPAEGRGFFDATLVLRHEPWSAAALRHALLKFPWMTAKVIGGIHWEALKLYLKKTPVFTHPDRLRIKHGTPSRLPR
jgi:hypothetical protein